MEDARRPGPEGSAVRAEASQGCGCRLEVPYRVLTQSATTDGGLAIPSLRTCVPDFIRSSAAWTRRDGQWLKPPPDLKGSEGSCCGPIGYSGNSRWKTPKKKSGERTTAMY